jgi:GNAT superfamily N-acetyltransferase
MTEQPPVLPLREIESRDDVLWRAWETIYTASFPPHERMSQEHFDRVLDAKSKGEATNTHIVVIPDSSNPDDAVCMAYYEYDPETRIAFLWYLATREGLRGQGIGAVLYRSLREYVRGQGAALLVYEVEIPEVAAEKSAQDADYARRRIEWYEKFGARVVFGIEYFQGVDTTPEKTPMYLMVDLFEPMEAEALFPILKSIFEDSLAQTGTLSLARLSERDEAT